MGGFSLCHCFFGCFADCYDGQPGRGGYGFLRAAAENVDLVVVNTYLFPKHGGYGINYGHDSEGFQEGQIFEISFNIPVGVSQ